MECVESDGDLLLRLVPSKLAVHITSNEHGEFLLENITFHRFRRRLVTARDAVLDASGVYTALCSTISGYSNRADTALINNSNFLDLVIDIASTNHVRQQLNFNMTAMRRYNMYH